MKKYILITVAVWILSGCSSSVEQTRYSLIDSVAPQAFDVEDTVRLTISGALSEPGLVLRVSPVTVQAAKYHLWDMAPADQLSILFNDELIKSAYVPSAPVRIWVSRFDGTPEGTVTVAAAFKTKSKDGTAFEKSVTWKGVQKEDGYASLVEALKEGFMHISQEVIQELKSASK